MYKLIHDILLQYNPTVLRELKTVTGTDDHQQNKVFTGLNLKKN